MVTPFTIDTNLVSSAQSRGAAEARAEATTASNIETSRIAQDISRFNHAKAVEEERKVGIQTRNNRAMVAQKRGIDAQRNLDFTKSDAGGLYHTKLLQQGFDLQIKNNSAAMLAKDVEMQVAEAGLAGKVAEQKTKSLKATVALQEAEDFGLATSGLNLAISADRIDKESGGMGGRTVDYITKVARSRPELFNKMYSEFKPFLDRASEDGTLAPVLQEAIRDATAMGRYQEANRSIAAGIGGIRAAEAKGQATRMGSAVVDSLNAMGIDHEDPTTLDNVSIEETEQGYFLASNAGTGRAQFFGKEQFDADPFLRGLKRDIRKRSAASFNSLTKSKEMQVTMAEIARNPMPEQMGTIYKTIVNDLQHVAQDKAGFMRTVNNVMAQMGEDAQAYNPMLREGGRKLYDMADKGILGETVTSGQYDIKRRFEKNPNEFKELLVAYNNRATGGMPESVYTEYVQQIARNVTANNPKFDPKLHSRRSIEDRKRALYSKIQNSVGVIDSSDDIHKVLRSAVKSGFLDTPAGKQFQAQNIGLMRQYFSSSDNYVKRELGEANSVGLMKAIKEYLIGGQIGRDVSVYVPDVKVNEG